MIGKLLNYRLGGTGKRPKALLFREWTPSHTSSKDGRDGVFKEDV